MTIPTSPGKIAAIAFLVAAVCKMFGFVPIKIAATDLLLAAIACAMILP